MIPSIISEQLEQGLKDFLKTTFPISSPFFHGLMDNFLEKKENIFKGPYLSINLPFRKSSLKKDFFKDISLKFPPFIHQELAFKRLSSENPKSTIIATGTGSGKTESFLYPIINYCYQKKGQKGIKAILIYPMNALATDQAKRLASIINSNENLKGKISAGLFVGQSEKDPHQTMGEENVITNKDILRDNPPDILLTNYKMLDYLLIRPKDFKLWKHNNPDTLRYLVVDELHTFDGAQGTDLSCLIRRLKARLETPENYLCSIGTSATIGGEDAKESLRKYASQLFNNEFDNDSIITENRINLGEFLDGSFITYIDVIPPEKEALLNYQNYNSYEDYIKNQFKLWFGEEIIENDENWKINLSDKLKENLFFRNLLTTLQDKNKSGKLRVRSYKEIISDLRRATRLPSEVSDDFFINLIISITSLISIARIKIKTEDDREIILPFLNIRFQLWTRELRRMVSSVEKKSKLKFSDDLKEEQKVKNLPVIHCRDCGTTGWSGIYKDDFKINNDLREFYSSFFSNSRFIVFLFPIEDKNFENIRHLEGVIYNLCGNCLCVSTENKKDCSSCKSNNVHRVFVPTSTINKNSKVLRVNNCPFCKSRNSLTILGSRAASLTSVLISQLFASNYNDDKKLITFSDSVQDAAHRAGFFSARTYQLNFRSALQHVIQENEMEKNLDDLTIDFQNYWSKKLGDEKKYIAQFLAPNMEWLADFNVLKETNSLPEKSDLKDLVDKRISWEITAEFGFKSKIGRTLEKTGSAVSYIDKNLIEKTIKSSIEKLQNEISFFRELKELELEKFLTGILTHLRLQGGIEHEIFKISSYIEKNGDTFILNKIPYMQSINNNSRIPRFITNIPKSLFEKIISQGTNLKTWYENWLGKIFNTIPFIFNQKEEIFKILLEELEKNSILFRHDSRKGNVWGIKSSAVKVSLRLKRMHCNVCDDKISIFEEDLNIWENLNCLRFECNGNFQIEEQKNNYYNKLYSTSDIERIVASEHTGLLERDVREKIEKNFINRMYPWHPNLLSATPTIEMGIDIGDLSSVILCSVPPTQSNYLQRIGRAGRKDGNAFNATVATGKSHDLYFYSDPKEMLEGNTSAPGIFLNASAILERQFTAFCLDDWVKTGIKESEIPYLIKNVLFNVKNNKINTFPYNFFNFIESNKERLFNNFLNLFKNEITSESIEQIKLFFNEGIRNEGGLIFKINQGLIDLNKEKESYNSKRGFIQKKIKEKYNTNAKDQNYEKELEELYREKIGLTGLIKKIESKETLNYFTDEGLLPNYSFPEAGVILKSVIFRKRKNVKFTKDETEDNKYYDQWTYEYERAAASAINEFAPSNTFYAEGRKVKIDQIDLNTTEIETWQFCDKCSYNTNTEKILSKHISCPRCNSNMWSDSAQKKNMIKIRQVFASTNDKDSRIGDDSDDRQPMFYNTQMLVDIDNIHIKDAYKIKDDKYPFGFEFVSKANFRNINFGERTDQKEKEITISGKKSSRKGFMICKDCGKLQKDDEPTHTILCKTKDKENNFVECLYLYREFTSEAIKILLPIATIAGSEKKLSSLIASLQLGLKKKFGGAVDHLKVTTYEEHNEKDISKKQYLIIYDTVPGGTGYLKQLMRSSEPIMEVLEIVINTLKQCDCNNDPEKDGCYKCLYAYKNSTDLAHISRNTAINILSEIFKYKNELEKTDSLRKVIMNGLMESVLEENFIEVIRKYNKNGIVCSLSPYMVNNKSGFLLKVNKNSYYIQPQVSLLSNQGIDIGSKSDFLISPIKIFDIDENIKSKPKPIAIFTDGFKFHPHEHRVGKDTAQRMAIVQSGNYNIWSLSWNDVNEHISENFTKDYFFEYIKDGLSQKKKDVFDTIAKKFKVDELSNISSFSSFDLLVKYLSNPDEVLWKRFSAFSAFMQIDQEITNIDKSFDIMPENILEIENLIVNNKIYGDITFSQNENIFSKIFISSSKESLQKNDFNKIFYLIYLNDSFNNENENLFKKHWNSFLRLYNIMQFMPVSFFITKNGKLKNDYEDLNLKLARKQFINFEEIAMGDEWNELLEYSPDYNNIIRKLFELKLPIPELGYELSIESDIGVEGEAEIVWVENKIALLTNEQLEYKEKFESLNWKVFEISKIDEQINIIKSFFSL